MIKETLYKFYKKFEKWLIATGIIVVAFGAGETQFQKGGVLYDGISTAKVIEKYAQAPQEIKGKYQLDGSSLKIQAPDKNSVAVSLGDKTKPDFEPKLEIKRWENETRFSIKPKGLELIQKKDKDLVFEGDKIKFQTPDIEYHFYDAPTSSDEGGYEYEIVLNKYTTSTFYSEIETQGLEFYKQLPLTQEQAEEGETCYETYCEKDGQKTRQRPENVVNSYAVYHATQSNDYSQLGGYNYRAGKAFHIYRVKAIDSDGLELWCDQNIYGNTHEISCDNNWLEKIAKYPVKIDPTIGNTTLGASNTTANANEAHGIYTNNNISTNAIITSASYGSASSGKNVKIFIINSSEIITNGISNALSYNSGWSTTTFSTSPTVVSGNYYVWFVPESNLSNYRLDSGGASGISKYETDNNYSSPTFPSGTTNSTYIISIYATYEPASTYSRNSTTTINNGRIQINNGRIKQ